MEESRSTIMLTCFRTDIIGTCQQACQRGVALWPGYDIWPESTLAPEMHVLKLAIYIDT